MLTAAAAGLKKIERQCPIGSNNPLQSIDNFLPSPAGARRRMNRQDLSQFHQPINDLFVSSVSSEQREQWKLPADKVAFFHENGYVTGPKILTDPLLTVTRELIMPIAVDLPAPFGPNKAKKSPASTSKSIPFNASKPFL